MWTVLGAQRTVLSAGLNIFIDFSHLYHKGDMAPNKASCSTDFPTQTEYLSECSIILNRFFFFFFF